MKLKLKKIITNSIQGILVLSLITNLLIFQPILTAKATPSQVPSDFNISDFISKIRDRLGIDSKPYFIGSDSTPISKDQIKIVEIPSKEIKYY